MGAELQSKSLRAGIWATTGISGDIDWVDCRVI